MIVHSKSKVASVSSHLVSCIRGILGTGLGAVGTRQSVGRVIPR